MASISVVWRNLAILVLAQSHLNSYRITYRRHAKKLLTFNLSASRANTQAPAIIMVQRIPISAPATVIYIRIPFFKS